MKKLILALILINLSSYNIKACCAEDVFQDDYNSLASSIQNLLYKKPVLNTEQIRVNFIIESGKIIQELPSFYNLFRIGDSLCTTYGEAQEKLMMIARDLISKSLDASEIGYEIGGMIAPPPSAAEIHGYIVDVIKRVKSNQSCCVIL